MLEAIVIYLVVSYSYGAAWATYAVGWDDCHLRVPIHASDTLMADEKRLPGWPNKTLVRKVRSCLWHYLRSRPQVTDPLWRTTWEWAHEIKNRNMLYVFGKQARRERWPAPNEIASTYLYLAITEMQTSIRLPHNAKESMPESVKQLLHLAARIKAVRTGSQQLLSTDVAIEVS